MSLVKSISKEQVKEMRRLMLQRDELLPMKLEYDAAEARVISYLRRLQLEADVPTTTSLNEDGSWAGLPPEGA